MTQNSDPESERVQNLKENLAPYFIRIKKDDLGLPKINEELISLEMNKFQKKFMISLKLSTFQTLKVITLRL